MSKSAKAAIIFEAIILVVLIIILIVIFFPKGNGEQQLPDYKEAEKIFDPITTKKNHEILNKTFFDLDVLIPICNNISFPELKINITIDKLPENLDFLKNSTESSVIVAKEDLELYLSQYSNISREINNLTIKFSEMIKKISESLNEYKNEINELSKQYEKNIQNLALPFLVNSNYSTKLRYLDSDESFEKYKAEAKKLNRIYNSFIIPIGHDTDNICKAIQLVIDKTVILIKKVGDVLKYVLDSIKSITMESLHEALIGLKEKIVSFHNDLTSLKDEINGMIVDISKFSDSLGKKESNFIENILNLSLQLGKGTINIVPIIANFLDLNPTKIDLKNPKIVSEKVSISKVKLYFALTVYAFDFFFDNIGMFNVETSTSLDLLFIVDITGSMDPYLKQVKNELINIINGIVNNCPGIDINLGFIGYEDFYEMHYDIDFTKDHEYIKNYIKRIYPEGGGSYYPDEDVALALELALKKNWKSKAKLAVFIADAPGHGEKYGGHNTSSSDPERREIDEMITEMAEESISLFCLRITNKTDIMFKVFKDIYNKKKQNNTLFKIINNENISFSGEIIDYATSIYLEQRHLKEEGCLMDKKSAIEVLKNEYGIDNKNPDDNLRFILGKCSPVLLVPGVYSTKLKVEFNCKGLATEEKDTTLKNIRLYCGNEVCKDESKTSEEHPLLFSLLEKAFGIEVFNAKKYGTCLGYIATFFQNENECPKVGKKRICFHSKYVKVGYYGGTTNTVKKGRCGVEGISNVVQTGDLLLDKMISKFATVADSFYTISRNLINLKYKEGFSLAALPNDFRRYLASNNFATEVFKSQINRLYENTGKPVIIVAHSYGTLLTLTNLLKNKNDKDFMKKIKKFIAMAPPFAGSSKLLDVFLHATNDLNNKMTNYPNFGQYLIYKSLPTIVELRPQPMAAKIFTSPDYKELGNALRDRLEIERDCKEKNCDISEIEAKTKKFDEIFEGYFPSLLDYECKYESPSDLKYKENANNRKCFTNIYNVGDCPTIITKSNNPTKSNFEKGLYCNLFGKEYFYQGECDNKERNCLDEMYYSNKCPNVYSDKNAVDFMINRFNKDFSKKYGKIDEKYFDDYETIKNGVKNSIEHQKNIDLIKELPVPPVDTELVYATFYPTIAALILDDNDFTKEGKIFDKGGDDTVPAWSSLLTGLKWIYDKKNKNLSQNIKLIEYCSRLAKSGKYKYDPTRQQNFAAISCSCLNKDDNLYDEKINDCSHAGMLHDENLFNYIYSVVNVPNETIIHTQSKKTAAKKYQKYYDYEGVCNNDIYQILDKAK